MGGLQKLKVITWNINSVRLRLGLVTKLAGRTGAGRAVSAGNEGHQRALSRRAARQARLCPSGDPRAEGLSRRRHPFEACRSKPALQFCENADCRHICGDLRERHRSCTISMCRRAPTFPIPSSIPNSPTSSTSCARWRKAFESAQRKRDARVILVGDLNVAPLENDVWSHKQLLDVVSHTPVETDLLKTAQGGIRLGRRHAAIHSRRAKRSIPGGAIARRIGRHPIAVAGSIISGSARA
jgi:exodeoxyribonuclease-3